MIRYDIFEHLFVIDQVNLDWIERQKSGNGRKFTEHEIIDNLFHLFWRLFFIFEISR